MKNKYQYADSQRPFRIGLHGVFQSGMIWISIILMFSVLAIGFKLLEKKYNKPIQPVDKTANVVASKVKKQQ